MANNTIGQFIKNLRKEKGLTLTQMGARLNIDSGALSKIENGKRKLDEKVLPRLAEEFNLDLQELKKEYLSEIIAIKIYSDTNSDEILKLAEKKIKYFKQNEVKQISLNL